MRRVLREVPDLTNQKTKRHNMSTIKTTKRLNKNIKLIKTYSDSSITGSSNQLVIVKLEGANLVRVSSP
jgi:hypothetical protein